MGVFVDSAAVALPLLAAVIIIFGLIRLKSNIFGVFLQGAGDGIKTTLQIIPSLVGLVTAVEMFRSSGALDFLANSAAVVTDFLHIPPDIVPMLILRPISGSGTVALLDNLLKTCGADSLSGRMASTICASGETTFYSSTLYFGSVGTKHIRHTLIAALFADFVGITVSVITVNLFFG